MDSEPTEYTGLDADALAAAEAAAITEFNTLADTTSPTSGTVAELAVIADRINAIRAEKTSRVEAAEQLAELRLMVNAAMIDADPGDDVPPPVDMPEVVEPVADPEPELVTAAAPRPKVDVRDVISTGSKLNASLSQAARHVPPTPRLERPHELIITASADIPGYAQGAQLNQMSDLVSVMQRRARTLRNGSGKIPVAQVARSLEYTMDSGASEASIHSILNAVTNPSVLTAAGGWCAPSTISYDFFDIICEEGLIDLPTIGITRGGMRWPTSPSFADFTGNVWSWNETQDIAAVTGIDQSGFKTCFRAECATYNEARLACDGMCVTAGNLTNDAFPELIVDQINKTTKLRAHVTNANIIAQLVTGSTQVTYTATGYGWAEPVLSAVEQQVIDYRIKHGMCNDAILEAVFPTWILAGFRADLAKRTGLSDFDVTDEMIGRWFAIRGVRVQFVQDWQVRTAGLLGQATPTTSWPDSVDFLLYAAGTWVKGTGMTLDLGIIRDSTLNATNDYTAAWMEECYLVAMIGHESRVVTVPLCANGATAATKTFNCTL